MALEAISVPPASGKPPQGAIVALHGWGANANDLSFLAAVLGLTELQFYSLDAPHAHPHVPGGRMWYDLEREDYWGLDESRDQVQRWLKKLENRGPVGLDRVFLCGFSQGGAMALDVGTELPVAGVASLSGYLHRPLTRSLEAAAPIFMAHGRRDLVVPPHLASQARQAICDRGGRLHYEEFDMGHEICIREIDALRMFIQQVFQGVLPAPCADV